MDTIRTSAAERCSYFRACGIFQVAVAIHLLRPVNFDGEYCVKSIAHSGFQCGLYMFVGMYVQSLIHVWCACVYVWVRRRLDTVM